MAEIRLATASDAELLADQRRRMFADAGLADESGMQQMVTNFVPWVREKIEDGSYMGWLAEQDSRIVAGAGLWILEWPPHYLDPQPRRAYLLNFYVAPEARRQGLARKLLQLSVAEAKTRGVKVITLHASKFGKPLYEQHGFEVSNEMILRAAQMPDGCC
jgi:GNAT superfamily N-acetyltransferase